MAGHKTGFICMNGMENDVCPTEQRPRTKAVGDRDGYVQNMMDWLVGMLRFCLKRGKRTENRRKSHGWIDRLRGYFMKGIS